jgi:hypothetical protein
MGKKLENLYRKLHTMLGLLTAVLVEEACHAAVEDQACLDPEEAAAAVRTLRPGEGHAIELGESSDSSEVGPLAVADHILVAEEQRLAYPAAAGRKEVVLVADILGSLVGVVDFLVVDS